MGHEQTMRYRWALALALGTQAVAADPGQRPWMNTQLSPDERARLLEREMTMDERLSLVHSPMALDFGPFKKPAGAIPAAGYVAGIARLGMPSLQESDASLGVTNPANSRPGDTATALPSGLALAATWDPRLARAAGAAIGREAHAKGFNVLLAGGANLTRDPRGGRNFEYLGEDPLLAGVMAGESVAGIQGAHVVSTIKHFALNAYETSRNTHNVVIGEAPMRESDLLAFQLAIERGRPGSLMCAYNKVNAAYACESEALLGKVLKGDWGYPGWVMSDWGAVHALDAVKVLDHQSGEQLDKEVYFGEPLKKALAAGQVAPGRVSDMVRRMLRSMFANGLFEHPAGGGQIDYAAHGQLARRAAAEGMVLLRNENGMLPLRADVKRIAVIGGNASVGVLSGAGSSQVTPHGEPPVVHKMDGTTPFDALFRRATWFAPGPLAAIREPGCPDRGRRGGQSAHGGGARNRQSGADAVAGPQRRRAAGLVSRPARRPGHRRRAVRPGQSLRPPADDLPALGGAVAAPRPARRRPAAGQPLRRRLQRGRRRGLPLVRQDRRAGAVPVRPRPVVYQLRGVGPAGRRRQDLDRQLRPEEHRRARRRRRAAGLPALGGRQAAGAPDRLGQGDAGAR